jgi:hypothetical protein
MAFADNPWFKYPALAVLGGASAYVLVKPSARAPVAAVVGALAAPLVVFFGSRWFSKWEPASSCTPFLNETLVPISAPKMPSSLPEGFDPVKASFFKGQTTGKLYASTEISQGGYTTAQWWVR